MSQVIDLDSKRPDTGEWFNAFAMCLPCSYRWIATVEARMSLFSLECPQCGARESYGSIPPAEYTEAVARAFPLESEPNGNP